MHFKVNPKISFLHLGIILLLVEKILQVVPALCAAVTHKNFREANLFIISSYLLLFNCKIPALPRLIFTVFSAFLFGTTLGVSFTKFS